MFLALSSEDTQNCWRENIFRFTSQEILSKYQKVEMNFIHLG